MRFKAVASLLILFFLLGSIVEVEASAISDVLLQSGGILINVTFPEEAHSTETVTYNVTITAFTILTIQNFTMVINAIVDSNWQQVYKEQIISRSMELNENLTMQVTFTLPQLTHDRLYCYIYALTDKPPEDSIYTFYSTYVRSMAYDELLGKYDELLSNYSSLISEYHTLLYSYNNASEEYTVLYSEYNSLFSQYTQLQTSYSSLNSSYHTQQGNYSSLLASFDTLERDYDLLNQTYTILLQEPNILQQNNDILSTDLNNTRIIMFVLIGAVAIAIALIIYIKKKGAEPYIVVRKETVALKTK